ncbi:hypothetical protein G9F31_10175 [Acinetobacter sp. 187]|uniref:hypothetical protein n=1 Tax=Acinetobacter lanii TaxID=2715163 RepID=UPI00140B37D2|nr:hypothetical protein [Acinetobacter lanii]NHC04134.1 hypothetical protein [Acinetobacter lanii]
MAKRNKCHKSKQLSKQRNPIQQPIIKEAKSADKPLKHEVIIEFVKQIPFWWQQSKELRDKIIAWLLNP